jgi:hypothetical protein
MTFTLDPARYLRRRIIPTLVETSNLPVTAISLTWSFAVSVVMTLDVPCSSAGTPLSSGREVNRSSRPKTEGIHMFLPRPLLLVVFCWITACAQQNPLAPSQARTAIPTLIDQSSGKPEPAGLPFYARLERTFQPIRSDEWAAIVFYRQPSCVPSGFNLLDFLDIPRVFGCPLTVDGFQIWKDPFPALPIQVNIAGLGAVPIWFVSWVELQAAMADDLVTIGELQGLNSLVVGSANSYRELLHPGEELVLAARGVLEDGRQFSIEYTYAGGATRHARIVFD